MQSIIDLLETNGQYALLRQRHYNTVEYIVAKNYNHVNRTWSACKRFDNVIDSALWYIKTTRKVRENKREYGNSSIR